MREIEAKIRVPDLEPVQARLREFGARFVGRYIENNHILDRHDGSLRGAGCGLRVRWMQTVDGQDAAPTVTFKGPVQESPVKRREEIEVDISDADRMLLLLGAIGFETVVSYRKRRERWTLDDCHVELDEVPLVGTFVEIEGPCEATIRAVQARLGLGSESHVRHGYVGMLLKRCRELGRSAIGIDFS